MGRLILDTGQMVAAHIDRNASVCVSLCCSQPLTRHFPCRYMVSCGLELRTPMAELLATSASHKGRLLHYLPLSRDQLASAQRWGPTHTDRCLLTGKLQLLAGPRCRGLVGVRCCSCCASAYDGDTGT